MQQPEPIFQSIVRFTQKLLYSPMLHSLRALLAYLTLALSASASGMQAPQNFDRSTCWQVDNTQISQAFESVEAAPKAYLDAKSASSPIGTGASSYENKSFFSTLSSVKPAQRYEKVTDTISSFKEQTLLHLSLSNGQTIQATAGHPFKTSEGWRDAVLLKKGGQLLLGGEADAAERYTTILEIREEVKTTAVFTLEVANLHTFFVGVDGVVVHNGARGPSTDPNALHNKTIREIGDLIRAAGGRVIAGGGGKERLIPTPCGAKSGRRPDILYTDRLGKERAVNVGKNGRDGQPVTRERQAMSDLNGAGVPTTFIPYN